MSETQVNFKISDTDYAKFIAILNYYRRGKTDQFRWMVDKEFNTMQKELGIVDGTDQKLPVEQ
jgi:hypothetical protein